MAKKDERPYKFRIFLSFSGQQSKKIAEALHTWLPKVIQILEPWMSKSDISAGSNWADELRQALEPNPFQPGFAVLCLTPENLAAPWILFEAGALSTGVDKDRGKVCPYLVGVGQTAISGPLAQFQCAEATKSGTMDLMAAINKALGQSALPAERLKESFDKWWPELEPQLGRTRKAIQSGISQRTLRAEETSPQNVAQSVTTAPNPSFNRTRRKGTRAG
jgi:hypothetical protein